MVLGLLLDVTTKRLALLSLEIIAVYEDFYSVLTEVLEGLGLSDMEILRSIEQFGLCLRPIRVISVIRG